jgi:hypothetical protein
MAGGREEACDDEVVGVLSAAQDLKAITQTNYERTANPTSIALYQHYQA